MHTTGWPEEKKGKRANMKRIRDNNNNNIL